MSFNHLKLLIGKSIRYAWRRRMCRCCPKILFEFIIPIICLLLLCLLRWIYTSTQISFSSSTSSSIISAQESIRIWNYTSVYRCPPSHIPIKILANDTLTHLKRICPRSRFFPSSTSSSDGQYLFLNTSSKTSEMTYRCQYNNRHWCEKTNLFTVQSDSLQLQHPSSALCLHTQVQDFRRLLQGYLAVQSLLNRPIKKQQLIISTWPCSSYLSDRMFEVFPRFTWIIILLLVDGCILFSFNFLFHELIDEKQQGITELLRLLSIHPLLNSLAWFIRILCVQILLSIFLVFIWKISIHGGIYLPNVSIWWIIPTIFLWTIQVLSRSILVAHFFSQILSASLWSWLIYLISFWLAVSPVVQLPFVLHLIISAWLPFYSIKGIFLLFFQINADLGRQKSFINEIILMWLSMIIGSLLMWMFAAYFEPIRSGKYGLRRSWLWPWDYFRSQSEHTDPTLIEPIINDQITVRVDNLTKTFGRHRTDRQVAVDHISFALENSHIYGLIGHNGAGKTTTMEMLCGLLSYDVGRIEIHQKNLTENLHEVQSSIGYCPQEDMLFSDLTVREQLEFYASVRTNGKKIDHQQIQQLLSMMGMEEYQERLCHSLSGGMARKLSILCALVGPADVIILDEPSSSLDPVARRILWSWLRAYKINRTLLISSHLLDEVEELCDSIIILDSGRILAQGTILQLKQRFGPSGDRIYLDIIPSYIPQEWIIDGNNHYIQIPDRKQCIQLLHRFETDQINYSLVNTTLDEIFLQLISKEDASSTNDDTNQAQINTLFSLRTKTSPWLQQILGVFLRRCQVLAGRARLLLVVIVFYLIYALAPLYMPSFAPSIERTSYVISSPLEWIEKFDRKNFETESAPTFASSIDFQNYLSELSLWSSNHRRRRKLIGIRIHSSNQFECYVPPPALSNIISSCLPIFAIFSNRSIAPLHLLNERDIDLSSSPTRDNSIFCFSILPPSFHFSIILICLVLLIPAAFAIRDYTSGLYSYSLIHGLSSPIHWLITFLSDLILCLLWLGLVVLIARFVQASTFTGLFFVLTSLLFIVDLPFIYLLAKFFQSPVLGATVIVFLLQLAHLLNAFKIFFEILRAYAFLSKLIPVIRWLLLIIFPNVNAYILIEAVLRRSLCPYPELIAGQNERSSEYYPYQILIHTMIFLIQLIGYFILLVVIDTIKWPSFGRGMKNVRNEQEEDDDDDVIKERDRIESMNEQDQQNQKLILKNLSKSFPGTNIPALNRLTFAVPSQQRFGLLGFNGSGKTTTFRILVGEIQASAGRIYKSKQTTIGYCPQKDVSFSALTVLQSIDYICRLHGLQPSLLNQIILREFQLEKHRCSLVSNLSGGTRRRLHLALCLIGSPDLLLLDEPTAKIDPLLRRHIRRILQHRPIDTSIIFASHSMFECEQLCDRLTILVRGCARCLGSPKHLKVKYGMQYRIRLTLLQSSSILPSSFIHVDNSNEYVYSQDSLAELFTVLERLVEQNVIALNYSVQLTSLEQIFLSLQHSLDSTSQCQKTILV